MKYLFMVFVLVALVIIIGGHLLLHVLWVRLFDIDDPMFRRVLMVILMVLAASFIATTLLVHWWENIFTSALYEGAATWIGVVWYLFVGTVLAAVVVYLAEALHWNIRPAVVASVFLAAAVLYSAYGVWNAFHPRVVRHSISLPGAPAQWPGRTIVQLSDIHLGAINHRRFAEQVVAQVRTLNPDVIFITGDLFDGAGRQLGTIAEPLGEINPPQGMYYITGNHETYLGLDLALGAVKAIPTVRILRDQLVDLDGIQLLGIDYPLPGQRKDVSPLLQQLDRNKASIVLYHEPTVSLLRQFREAGTNLFLAGHTHRGQLWPFGWITRAMYKGYDYGLHREGRFTQYTTTGVGTWGPPMRTGNRPEIVVFTIEK